MQLQTEPYVDKGADYYEQKSRQEQNRIREEEEGGFPVTHLRKMMLEELACDRISETSCLCLR
jgi:hypothetical protein